MFWAEPAQIETASESVILVGGGDDANGSGEYGSIIVISKWFDAVVELTAAQFEEFAGAAEGVRTALRDGRS
ncbi:hypothetical protein [Nocardia sp. NPDC004711]